MRVIVFFLLLFFAFVPSFSYAREPRCGAVDDDVVEDAYERAGDVSVFGDYRPDIVAICAIMEQLKIREKAVKASPGRAYRAQRRDLVSRVEQHFEDFEGALKVLDLWRRADARNDRDRVVRVVRIRKVRERIDGIRSELTQEAEAARALSASLSGG